MEDRAVSNILAKVKLLESKLGQLAHKPLRPFVVNPSDPLNLQEAAAKLAAHVGLSDLTFIVALAKQKENVGGHVELRYAQREVFIELDGALTTFPQAALCALAHEVTHKLLHHHQIWIEPVLENERLTDIAAMYAGFGAIMLNGCEVERVEQVENGTRTSTFSGGYLNRGEFGLVFAVLERLGANKNGREDLNTAALAALAQGQRILKALWPSDLTSAADDTRESIRSEQASLSGLAKDIVYLRDHVLPTLEATHRAAHERLAESLGELRVLTAAREPRVNQIRGAELALEGRRSRQAISRGAAFSRLRKQTSKAASALEAISEVGSRTTEMFRHLQCPIDDTKLRIPPNKKRVEVRCPKCNYKFIADSTLDAPAVKPTGKKSSWFRRS